MNTRVFITIDTEEDDWGRYDTQGHTVENIDQIPLLQEVFDRYGARPTYLVSYPVSESDQSRKILLGIYEKGKCEIGTHCHPWNTPPFEEETSSRNSMLCNLSQELVEKKIEALHDSVARSFSIVPVCFRTGRWGFGPNVARSLSLLGYRIDTSITPFVDWTANDGPDFSDARSDAYYFDPDDIFIAKDKGPLLEIPPTIGYLQNKMKLCHATKKWISGNFLSRYHLLGILDRMGVVSFRWLSPEMSNASEMISLAKNFNRLGYRFLNMSFHSTTLLPGRSPFVRNQQELEIFLKNIEEFLLFAANQGMSFHYLSEATECNLQLTSHGKQRN